MYAFESTILNVLYTLAGIICRPGDRVLKTDLWNEEKGTNICTIPGEVFKVEINYLRCLLANTTNKVCGNVLRLPFKDESFDVVCDLSTIDHCGGFQYILAEYYSVLKMGGKCLVSSWLADEEHSFVTDTANRQWLYNSGEFEKIFRLFFSDVACGESLPQEMAKAMWTCLGDRAGVCNKWFIGTKRHKLTKTIHPVLGVVWKKEDRADGSGNISNTQC